MHEIGTFAALSWRFRLSCEPPPLAAHLTSVLGSLRCEPTDVAADYAIARPPSSPARLFLNGELLLESWASVDVLSYLLWHINAAATERTTEHVLLHAAAAEAHGRAVILCAPMEAGKTTLVAALVLAGLRYLTDEAVAIRPLDGAIVPFPKALSVDPGSWLLLPELKPHASTVEAQQLLAQQWQVPPQMIRDDAVSSGAVPAVIVLPQYVAGAATSLEPITPGTALVEVLQQTFHVERQRARDMSVLAAVLQGCTCYRLRSGDLGESRDLVLSALQQGAPSH